MYLTIYSSILAKNLLCIDVSSKNLKKYLARKNIPKVLMLVVRKKIINIVVAFLFLEKNQTLLGSSGSVMNPKKFALPVIADSSLKDEKA
jgi:hypothetical protein